MPELDQVDSVTSIRLTAGLDVAYMVAYHRAVRIIGTTVTATGQKKLLLETRHSLRNLRC